ncbi:hypothetical protein CSOJ01_11166 [Colletotrichum sojae]|uniref:Uncharacterized protein n=1 Tax=Colletotrichum sojae TaxID=2175907 RepID=A0A8H6MNF6_9PEZI|nr:hypothetical protein CSOJ01_11166 [Colletotrichum sojae]
MSPKYTVGDGSPFLKRVIVPFYVVRMVVMFIEIIIYALAIAFIAANKDSLDREVDQEGASNVAIAIVVVIMVIVALCLSLDLVCIIKRSRRTLTPLFFLIANCIETGIWTVLFVLSMIGISGTTRGLSIIVAIVVYASFFGMLIYASVIFHRHRKGTLRGDYTPANQNQPTAYHGSQQDPAKPYNPQPYEMENRYA